MTERVGMEITVDAKQANAEIQNIRKGAMQLKESLEKQAGAIGAVTMAFGHQDGEIGKVIRGIGGLAVAYGTAGPLGVALAATAAAVEMLNSHWEDSIKLQDKALMAGFAEQDKAAALLKKTNDEIAKMRDDLLPLTKAQRDYRDTMREVAAVEAELARIRADGKFKTDDQRNALRLYELSLDRLNTKANLQQAVAGRGATAARAGGSSRAVPNEPEAAAIGYGDDTALPAGAWVYNGPSEAALADLESARTEVIKTETEQRLRIAEDAHRQMLAMEAERQLAADETAAVVTNGVISVITMSAQLAVADAKGHKAMMAQMLGATVSAAGGFITMKGGEALAAGLSRAFISSGTDPGAYAAIAGGTALILAGQAVQQGGPAAINGLMGVNGSASGGGRSGGVSTGERGFGRRSRQSSGSGGTSDKPAQIVNVWGVDGPQAEDQARRTVRSNRLARRRGFA